MQVLNFYAIKNCLENYLVILQVIHIKGTTFPATVLTLAAIPAPVAVVVIAAPAAVATIVAPVAVVTIVAPAAVATIVAPTALSSGISGISGKSSSLDNSMVDYVPCGLYSDTYLIQWARHAFVLTPLDQVVLVKLAIFSPGARPMVS